MNESMNSQEQEQECSGRQGSQIREDGKTGNKYKDSSTLHQPTSNSSQTLKTPLCCNF